MFKQAKIIPLYKSGNPSDPSNYRPISILSILSKPLEQHIYKCLLTHLDKYNLIHPNQFGFRANHSCHTALLKLVDRWLSNINKKEFTGVLFVDFAKAFDVIDHKLLLRKLALYKLSSCALELIASFLSNRQQKVNLNNCFSRSLPNKFGVPQGSVLGPLLFSLYINDLPLFVKTYCDLFADDTTIDTNHSDPHQVCRIMQENINILLEWTYVNHMALHPRKTKFMIISTRQKRQNLDINLPSLYIGNDKIEEVSNHKILGITIDNNLSWSTHIKNISKNITSKSYQLRKIKHFLTQQARKIFFTSYIQSSIDYASTLWDQASNNLIKSVVSVHKRAVKLVVNKSSSLTAADYQSINILPLRSKFLFNKGVLMHKILHGNAPPSLKNIFTVNRFRHSHMIDLPLPRITLFKSSLAYSGSWLWNRLPSSLKSETNFHRFKAVYHDFLMKHTNLTSFVPEMY